MVQTDPEQAKGIFLAKLREHHGNMFNTAMALGLCYKGAYQILDMFALNGKPREIRKQFAQRFRLPAA